MILIVGASGVLGRETARQLLVKAQPVRLLSRTPTKLEDLKEAGAEVVAGDLIDAPTLEQACEGVERVFAAAHSLVGRGKYKSEYVDDSGHRALIDAARAAKVSKFVYTSIQGAASNHPVDFFRTKHKIEEYLKASGMRYTILRPSAFMEWHAHTFNGKSILETGKTSLLGPGTKLRNFVAAQDVAHFAVMALTDPRPGNHTLEIGGPQNYSNNQVAELYGAFAGVTPKVSHMPRAVARMLSVGLKPFQPGVSRIMYMSSLPDDAFSETFDSSLLLSEYRVRLTPLEEFIQGQVSRAKKA